MQQEEKQLLPVPDELFPIGFGKFAGQYPGQPFGVRGAIAVSHARFQSVHGHRQRFGAALAKLPEVFEPLVDAARRLETRA